MSKYCRHYYFGRDSVAHIWNLVAAENSPSKYTLQLQALTLKVASSPLDLILSINQYKLKTGHNTTYISLALFVKSLGAQ